MTKKKYKKLERVWIARGTDWDVYGDIIEIYHCKKRPARCEKYYIYYDNQNELREHTERISLARFKREYNHPVPEMDTCEQYDIYEEIE